MARQSRRKLITGIDAERFEPLALTIEQRGYQSAVVAARHVLPELKAEIHAALARLLSGLEFTIDLNLCIGSGLEVWLAEPGRLLLRSDVLEPTELSCYFAVDHLSARQLGDLCLGGKPTALEQAVDPPALSATETRICSRLMLMQLKAVQRFLCNTEAVLPAQQARRQQVPQAPHYIPFKVRLLLSDEAIAWILWLPRQFFVDTAAGGDGDGAALPAASMEYLRDVPVRGSVEMARRSVSLRELRDCLAGRVLPIDLHSAMQFRLHDKSLYLGTVAEEGSTLVFQITGTTVKEQER